MKIIAVSDLHGYLPEIAKCDVVVLAGDFSPLNIQRKYQEVLDWCKVEFIPWILSLDCKQFIFIAGNHDFACQNPNWYDDFFTSVDEQVVNPDDLEKVWYLENESHMFDGKRFFGCPYSDIPNMAFSTRTGDPKGYNAIEPDLDLLIVHQAPDLDNLGTTEYGKHWGSKELYHTICERRPRVVVCGHIHSGNHNKVVDSNKITYYNASLKDEEYVVAYKPQIFEI